MTRNEYEVAVRESGLDGISRALLMAAASYRKWKAGEEVEPFLSVAILVEATGFSKNAVAARYTLLRGNGWLVPTGKKTHKNATYYFLEVGNHFELSPQKVYPQEVDPDEVQHHPFTGDSTIPSEGTALSPQEVSENVKNMEVEIVERLEEAMPPQAAGSEEEFEPDWGITDEELEVLEKLEFLEPSLTTMEEPVEDTRDELDRLMDEYEAAGKTYPSYDANYYAAVRRAARLLYEDGLYAQKAIGQAFQAVPA